MGRSNVGLLDSDQQGAVGSPTLDAAIKAQVYRRSRGGATPKALAAEYGRSPATITRIINEVRARRLLETKLESIWHPSFDDLEQHAAILGPLPGPDPDASPPSVRSAPADLPPYLASLYGAPLLSREQEAHLFRQMNFLKHRAQQILDQVDPARARATDLDEIDRLLEQAVAVKNRIIRSNLRLVVSIAKRHIGSGHDFFELVSDGNMALINAVEKFDFSRGNKFSTYASWAVMNRFARAIPAEHDRRDRFVTGHDERLGSAADHRADEHEHEDVQRRSRQAVASLLSRLEDRERRIIVSRFGLEGAHQLTLEQLGQELGITKERVRQLESRAQLKLRKIAAEAGIDPAAF
jgi:RNA polymerase primary sigma factor